MSSPPPLEFPTDPEVQVAREAIPAPQTIVASSYRPGFTLPVILFVLTLVSTTIAGIFYHQSFLAQQVGYANQHKYSIVTLLMGGFMYAFAVVGILLAHELGHYLACRYYGIAATLPHFIPFPLFSYAGTLGAFIRIKSPFGNRKQLFDVGVAGPLAGYAFALPALVIGMKASQVIPIDTSATDLISFGEPLIFKIVAHLFFDYSEVTETINLHPIGWAAWFGVFATSINLFPAGQLDGGHVTYALLGNKLHRKVSLGLCAALVLLSAVTWSPAYLFFGLLVYFLGLRHPQTLSDEEPLDTRRKWIAVLAAIVFALSFIPIPISVE